jgi:hypothetical protein
MSEPKTRLRLNACVKLFSRIWFVVTSEVMFGPELAEGHV